MSPPLAALIILIVWIVIRTLATQYTKRRRARILAKYPKHIQYLYLLQEEFGKD